MTTAIAPRSRKVRVLATLGPASNSPEMIATLFQAGADAFRVNMSHGDQQSKVAVIEAIRALEKEFGRPTTILADLQGPKLRVGKFDGGRTVLEHNSTFVLDRDPTPGDATRVELPHKEIFEAIEPGARLLLHAEGEQSVRAVLERIDGIEALGITPATASPAYWRTLGNRLAARLPLPEYSAERHAAWLAVRALS